MRSPRNAPLDTPTPSPPVAATAHRRRRYALMRGMVCALTLVIATGLVPPLAAFTLGLTASPAQASTVAWPHPYKAAAVDRFAAPARTPLPAPPAPPSDSTQLQTAQILALPPVLRPRPEATVPVHNRVYGLLLLAALFCAMSVVIVQYSGHLRRVFASTRPGQRGRT
ncbi:MAG: hypothetical protein AAFR04_06040 [Pseudomonadota bacterium]